MQKETFFFSFGPITRWRTDQNSRWDVSRSRRHNHDVLRECEQRRFQEIVGQLLQMRTTLVSFGDDYEDSEYRQSLTNDKRANDYQPTLHLRSGGPPSGQVCRTIMKTNYLVCFYFRKIV